MGADVLNSARSVPLSVSFAASLPLVQENFRRTIHLVDGEQVVYVESELESLLAFDRPINWGEHATIGPPFLELGKTVVEMSATRAMTRSYDSQSANPPHRLADFKEFQWPMAPGVNGDTIDVRPAPATTPVGDHTTSLMDPSRELVYVTAFHPDRRLLLGYIFRRAEFPWTQLWENYPANGRLARGLEFAVQPFDMPRRDVIQQNTLLGAPTYRWLPAKSTITANFLMFYTRTPEGMRRVDDVRLENGQIIIEDRLGRPAADSGRIARPLIIRTGNAERGTRNDAVPNFRHRTSRLSPRQVGPPSPDLVEGSRVESSARRQVRPATAETNAGVHDSCGTRAGHRHRRQYRDLQRGARHAPGADAVPEPRPAGHGLVQDPGQSQRRLGRRLRGMAPPIDGVSVDQRVDRRQPQPLDERPA